MPVSLLAAAGIHFTKKNPMQKINVVKTIYKARMAAHLSLFSVANASNLLPIYF